jgi:hypothetical protein
MPTPKLLGEMAEMEFLAHCARLGFRVSRPFGDSYPYDVIVDNQRTCWRVQVKFTATRGRNGLYQVHSSRSICVSQTKYYPESEIDFMAFYLVRVKTWYIVPIHALRRRLTVTLYAPYCRHRGIYSQYFEAWRLLKQPRPCTCTIHACADPAYDVSACASPLCSDQSRPAELLTCAVRDRASDPAPIERMHKFDDSIRSQFVAAGLVANGQATDISFGRQYLASADFDTKLAAVRIVSRFGTSEDVPALLQVSRETWGVRDEAGAGALTLSPTPEVALELTLSAIIEMV